MSRFDPTFTDNDDLVWLAGQEPRRGGPSAEATVDALRALLAHTSEPIAPAAKLAPVAPLASTHTAPAPAPAQVGSAVVATPRRWLRRTGLATATAAIAAIAVTFGLGALPSGGGSPTGPLSPLAPAAAQAAPLLRLTHLLSAAPPAEGDATLTTQHTSLDDGRTFTKYNLVTDDSLLNYFADSRDGLASATVVTGGVDPMSTTGRGTIHAWLKAAADASDDAPTDAAKRINDASGIPIPSTPPAGKDAVTYHRAQYVNHVWITAFSILELDGGRPDVRAGALNAMAGVGAHIEQTTTDGRAVIEITMTQSVSGGAYDEEITIDGTTGIPISSWGGDHGAKPSTSSTYDVERVQAADFGH